MALSRTLSERPMLGTHIQELYITQSKRFHSGGVYDKIVHFHDTTIEAVRAILAKCQPKLLHLHLFETIPEILNGVRTDNLQKLGLCIRSDLDGRDLPFDDHPHSPFNLGVWLNIIRRAHKTLTHLSIGGRLISTDAYVNHVGGLPAYERLVSLEGMDWCLHDALNHTWETGDLYRMMCAHYGDTLERLDITPLKEEQEAFVQSAMLPKVTAMKIGLNTCIVHGPNSAMLASLDTSCPALERLFIVTAIQEPAYAASSTVEAAINDYEYRNLIWLDMCLDKEDEDEFSKECVSSLESACTDKGLIFEWYPQEINIQDCSCPYGGRDGRCFGHAGPLASRRWKASE